MNFAIRPDRVAHIGFADELYRFGRRLGLRGRTRRRLR